MATTELLNNVHHKDLRVDTQKKAQYGDNVGACIVYPEEFRHLQKEYPIYFQKNSNTGEFQAVSLFGFDTYENLFLTSKDWSGNYIPALIRRGPFFIGLQKNVTDMSNAAIHIDKDSPRISKDGSGEAVFLKEGGVSPYLKDVESALRLIHEGTETSKLMFEGLLALDILEPFTLDITFNNGEQFRTNEYYTINQDRLFELPDSTLGELHRSGYLQLAYTVLMSLSNIQTLITMKNKLR